MYYIKAQKKGLTMRKLLVLCILGITLLIIAGCSNKKNGNLESEQPITHTESESIGESETRLETEFIKELDSEKETKVKEETSSSVNTQNTTGETSITDDSTDEMTKQEYIDDLQYAYDLEVELSLSTTHLDQRSLNQGSYTAFLAWDDELNKIYRLLKTVLSETEMNQLIQEELGWIAMKDEEVEKAAQEVSGGSMEPYIRNMTALNITKERTLELIDMYFDR